jgi:hypothetical protein
MECPNCGESVADDATPDEVHAHFYPRHAGRGYWVCLKCKRAFHETGIRVS